MENSYKEYWDKKKNTIEWFKKPKSIVKKFKNKYLFYDDGYTNVTYNCVQLNIIKGLGNKKAIIYFDKNKDTFSITYNQLDSLINYFIYLFTKKFDLSFQKQVIAIHSSANICSSISMLALAKLGITFCVIFDDLPKEAIKARLKLLKCKILITSTNNKNFNEKIKPIQREIGIKVLRFSYDLKKNNVFNTIKFLKQKNFSVKYEYAKIKNNYPLFILFTSGSTGVPKGIVHSSGSYLIYTKLTCEKKFGMSQTSTILTASDAGWINGHTYALFGPLSVGATTILIEKPTDLLISHTLKLILMKFRVTILYMPVTLIRLIKAVNYNQFFNTKYLKVLGSMGEPLSNSVAKWFGSIFSKKKLPIINTYFQTETGGIICSPAFNDKNVEKYYGSVGKPLTKHLGVFINEKNSEIKIKNPWPGCMINCLNGDEIWKKYFDYKKNFKLFDYGEIKSKQHFFVNGRIDDVINIRGHRVGSGEVESILLKNSFIKEACAIAIDDEIEGKKLIIFISVKKKISLHNIENIIVKNFGEFLKPKKIFFINELPKTRSGKILRRVLRNIYEKPNKKKLGDLSTIVNTKNLFQIIKVVKNEKNE